MTEPPVGIQWVFTWADAVQRQYQRISEAEDLVSAQPDALLFAVALGGLLQNAQLELGKGHHAIRDFKCSVPNAKSVRDIVSHLDEYSQGTGDLQESCHAGQLVVLEREYGTETLTIIVLGYELVVTTAAQAAAHLAEAVLGEESERRPDPEHSEAFCTHRRGTKSPRRRQMTPVTARYAAEA